MTLHPPLATPPNAANPFGANSAANLVGTLHSDAHGPEWAYFGSTPRPGYVLGRPHQGTDYAAPLGTPVLAMAHSTVVGNLWQAARGYYVLTHWLTQAGGQAILCEQHLSHFVAPVGSVVQAGATTGRVGESGQATGPHCHAELRFTTVAAADWHLWQTWRAVSIPRVLPGGDLASSPLYLPR